MQPLPPQLELPEGDRFTLPTVVTASLIDAAGS